jgi:Fe-S-cluster containining protein
LSTFPCAQCGICRHLDQKTNLCNIYESRPKICRVEEMFEEFKDLFSYEEYIALNLKSCKLLQEEELKS